MHHISIRPPPPSTWGAAAIARDEAGGLQRLGPVLLLVLAVPVDVIGRIAVLEISTFMTKILMMNSKLS